MKKNIRLKKDQYVRNVYLVSPQHRLLDITAVRIPGSRHYFCFRGCAAVRCMVGCLLALFF
jgi:hypothetical protein